MRRGIRPGHIAGGVLMAAALMSTAMDGLEAQAHALDAGSFRVGGTATATRSSSTTDDLGTFSTSRFGLQPAVQYFLVPQLAVGGTLNLSHTRSGDGRTTVIGAGPAVTYYFYSPGRTLHPYATTSASFGRWRDRHPAFSNSRNHQGIRGAGGLLVMLAPHVGLTGELFYDRTRSRTSDTFQDGSPIPDNNVSTVGFAAGFSIFLF
jgi:hypothetical protein